MTRSPPEISVPQNCTVLVIGGGPAGSYASACLAREGVDTVLLEADKFPRYHIGESTLPSLRHFLEFIGLDDEFNCHGFFKKIGAVFRLNQSRPDAFTNFLQDGGSNAYAWNVLRSESDDLLFRHAKACGAQAFDETKVDSIQFKQPGDGETHDVGRPVSATWSHRDGTAGSINFQYLVDASGRNGIVSTKYLKNRTFNQNFKNVANWAYWKTDNVYGRGTHMETAPYFEALKDASGWCWFMPLHDGTRSVGVVQDQKLATAKKRSQGSPSALEFYKRTIELAPGIHGLLSDAKLVTEIKSASDYSYTASTYHLRNTRVCGDAGCFIDPLFSSGVHLAITGGLSAALTIMSSLRGEVDEDTAGLWHSKKTVESYTRFFLAVSSAYKQIRSQQQAVYSPEQAIVQDLDEEGFQKAFDLLSPVIQGTTDTRYSDKMSQKDVSKIFDFCFKAFDYVPPEQQEALFDKLRSLGLDSSNGDVASDTTLEEVKQHLTTEERQIFETLHSRRMIRDDPFDVEAFSLGTIDGFAPKIQRGKLGLVRAENVTLKQSQLHSVPFLDGKDGAIREGTSHSAVVATA